MDPSEILDAIGMMATSFTPRGDQPDHQQRSYARVPSEWGRVLLDVAAGRPFVASVNGHGLGEVYEPTAISLLKQNDMIVAATGIYRLFTSPDSAWGLRTGVSPRLQGKGLFTSRLLPHLFDLVEGLYGGKRLHFFTEDEHNEPVKRQ